MASAYLGYFVVEDVQVAYEIFVAGEDKEEAYQSSIFSELKMF